MSSFLLAQWTYTGFKIKGNLFLRQLTKILKVPFLQFSWVYLLFCDIENCEIPKVRYWNYLYSETPAAKESFHISEANSTENWLKHNKQAAVGRAVTPRGVSQPSFYPTSDAEFKAKTSSPIYHLNKTIKKKKKIEAKWRIEQTNSMQLCGEPLVIWQEPKKLNLDMPIPWKDWRVETYRLHSIKETLWYDFLSF